MLVEEGYLQIVVCEEEAFNWLQNVLVAMLLMLKLSIIYLLTALLLPQFGSIMSRNETFISLPVFSNRNLVIGGSLRFIHPATKFMAS